MGKLGNWDGVGVRLLGLFELAAPMQVVSWMIYMLDDFIVRSLVLVRGIRSLFWILESGH